MTGPVQQQPVQALAVLAFTTGRIPERLSSFLHLVDICRLARVCKTFCVGCGTQQPYGRLAQKACMTMGGGVPDSLRLQYWAHKLQTHQAKAELSVGGHHGSLTELYLSCLHGQPQEMAAGTRNMEAVPRQAENGGDVAAGDNCASVPAGVEPAVAPAPPPPAASPGFSGKGALKATGGEGEILRDVGRTFPSQRMFHDPNGLGQNLLANVLKACMVTHPDVGYCQGMNFVAGALLLARLLKHPTLARRGVVLGEQLTERAPSDSSQGAEDLAGFEEEELVVDWTSGPEHQQIEEDVFWLMAALMSKQQGVGADLRMRELWLPGVPQMKLRVFQFDRLLLRELPKLHAHFRAIALQPEVLVSQWFLTLFAYSLPVKLLVPVWDCVFCDGWKALFRIGLARLRAVQQDLLQLEIEELGKYLRTVRHMAAPDRLTPGELLRSAYAIKVTRSMLLALQQDFAVQLLKEHLEGGAGEWLTRYGSSSSHSPEPPRAGDPPGGGRAQLGTEAVVRMMLLDDSLLSRLRGELATLKAPVAADTLAYQGKIQDASNRQQAARDEYCRIATLLMHLKLDMEDLLQKKHALQQQMHELLVCFGGSGPRAPPPTPATATKAVLAEASKSRAESAGRGLRRASSGGFSRPPWALPDGKAVALSGSRVPAPASKVLGPARLARHSTEGTSKPALSPLQTPSSPPAAGERQSGPLSAPPAESRRHSWLDSWVPRAVRWSPTRGPEPPSPPHALRTTPPFAGGLYCRPRPSDAPPHATPRAQLQSDLEQLGTRLAEVQLRLDNIRDKYREHFLSYDLAKVEAEEAEQLKQALSSQLVQLLMEQEARIDGRLRAFTSLENIEG